MGICTPTIGLKGALDGVRIILGGLFVLGERTEAGALAFGFNSVSMGNMLFRAMPLVMTGLSVAIAYRTGLFNIGAAGQYLMGTLASLFVALSIPSATVPAWIIWTLALLAGMLAGALWGAIPGLLKALLNINEVIACIMTNWLAANLVTWAFEVSNLKNVAEGTKTAYIYKTTFNNVATSKLGLDQLFPGSQVNGGILIAALFAVIVYIIITKTTFGYELKACGFNRYAARYAGIHDKRNIVLSMAIAGSLASLGGALYYLSGNTEFYWNTYQTLPGEGFNGIPVALLAANNPIAVIFTAMFMSMLSICGTRLSQLTAFNEYITNVIIAVIVYMSAFSLIIKMFLGRHARKDEPLVQAAVALTESLKPGKAPPDAAKASDPKPISLDKGGADQ